MIKPKKYSEVRYVEVKNKEQKGLIPAIIILEILILVLSIYGIKTKIKYEALKIENNELNKVVEMQKSMISDLQEDNNNLQKLIYGGNV